MVRPFGPGPYHDPSSPFASPFGREPEGADVWSPAQALGLAPGKVIEWLDPMTTAVDGSGFVNAWSTKGPANMIHLTSSGACTITSDNGVPFVNCPASSVADVFLNPTILNVVGLDVWMLAKMSTGKTGIAGLFGKNTRFQGRLYTRLDTGVIEVISELNNQLRATAGSVPIGPWFTARMQVGATTASLSINGGVVDMAVHSDPTFDFEMFGGAYDSVIEPWDGGIHSFLSVLGAADAELEANLTTHFGTLRNTLNGV